MNLCIPSNTAPIRLHVYSILLPFLDDWHAQKSYEFLEEGKESKDKYLDCDKVSQLADSSIYSLGVCDPDSCIFSVLNGR